MDKTTIFFVCEKVGLKRSVSFITHRNQLKDFEKVKKIGIDAYKSEQEEKVKILRYLLDNYNDGRRKNFFCIAVNLLELQDVQFVVEQIVTGAKSDNLALKEKSKLAENMFQTMAEKRNIVLT